jgi:hypothetical protein
MLTPAAYAQILIDSARSGMKNFRGTPQEWRVVRNSALIGAEMGRDGLFGIQDRSPEYWDEVIRVIVNYEPKIEQ